MRIYRVFRYYDTTLAVLLGTVTNYNQLKSQRATYITVFLLISLI